MKKIFTLCLLCALALAAASCDDKDDKGADAPKMTVNGQTETINSAIYMDIPADEFGENGIMLYLLKDVTTALPENDTDFGIAFIITESFYGKTIDLTKPLGKNSQLTLIGADASGTFEVVYTDGKITDDIGKKIVVTAGTLTLTRSGDNFTVKVSMTLADGNSLSADWAGTATKVEGDKGEEGGTPGTMIVNGQTETIKSAFYSINSAQADYEADFELYLLKDAYSTAPEEAPDFYVGVTVSESLLGKTLDLTQPLDLSTAPLPYFDINVFGNGKSIHIVYSDIIKVTGNATVTSGSMRATRNGDQFTLEIDLILSDGRSVQGEWSGTGIWAD